MNREDLRQRLLKELEETVSEAHRLNDEWLASVLEKWNVAYGYEREELHNDHPDADEDEDGRRLGDLIASVRVATEYRLADPHELRARHNKRKMELILEKINYETWIYQRVTHPSEHESNLRRIADSLEEQIKIAKRW